MGLSSTIAKEYNYLDIDLKDAYWYISQIGLGDYQGRYIVQYILTAYPTRESKQKTIDRAQVSQMQIGGSTHYYYEGAIYEFVDVVPFELIFEDNIAPRSLDELKTGAYNYIKKTYTDMNFIDVFESNQIELGGGE